MGKKLEGKIAVVTGGTAGIGLGAAKRFADEGARVFVTGRRQDVLDTAVAEIGHNAVGIKADASNLADIDRIYATMKETAGHIDVLMVNAGYYEFQTMGQITEAHFANSFNTNVKGLLFVTQKALPLLADGASVIFTGSIASSVGIPNMSVYSATNTAVRSFARSWFLDLRGRGIRINVLSPGHIATPGLDGLLTADQQNGLIANIPLGRLGTADDMGKAAMFLASDDSAYVNGIALFADGGVSQY
jgi:NAD(P)-dependent dehydrogenase (short-subunit alcohol dehydrogenase family)